MGNAPVGTPSIRGISSFLPRGRDAKWPSLLVHEMQPMVWLNDQEFGKHTIKNSQNQSPGEDIWIDLFGYRI